MTPFVNHKYFELITFGDGYQALSEARSDDEYLQFKKDTLAYHEFIVEYLTANNGFMARVIQTADYQLEYLINSIQWEKEAIENDELYRKARAYAREKTAKERSANPPDPLPADTITVGTKVTPGLILSFKYN